MAIEHKDIAGIRADYAMGSLHENDVDHDPIRQIKKWFDQALDAEVNEPNAFVLSTINTVGFPTSRVVLMKDIKSDGLSFFTNYRSQKAIDVEQNNKVSVLFFWPELQRQIRLEGYVEKLPETDSDEYFSIRPRGSQIGAWSSPQSEIIADRSFLEKRVAETEQRFAGVEHIPRPDFWGGYFIRPVRCEFWQGRSSRLHDRIAFILNNSNWEILRIAP